MVKIQGFNVTAGGNYTTIHSNTQQYHTKCSNVNKVTKFLMLQQNFTINSSVYSHKQNFFLIVQKK